MNQSQALNKSTDPDLAKPKSVSQSKLDHWKPIISAWRDSGLSQSAFCKKNDVSLPRFTYWWGKILGKTDVRRQPAMAKPDASPFVPVYTTEDRSHAGLRISFPNGIILSGIDQHNVALLKAIVQAL